MCVHVHVHHRFVCVHASVYCKSRIFIVYVAILAVTVHTCMCLCVVHA